MSRRIVVAAAFCTLMLAVPLGAAWSGKGDYEPSMLRDITDGWMYTTSDVNPSQLVEKVYLNGFTAQCASFSCTQVNPNVGAVRSAIFAGDGNFRALFGVWKDCNKDNAIGDADQGLFEYRSELLFGDTSVCPVLKTPNPIYKDWFPSHNDGTWVREFLPIGWYDDLAVTTGCATCAPDNLDKNPYNINDNGARVWADYGLPEDKYSPSCPLIPVERGTFHSVGGLLHTYDCREGYTVTDTFDGVADSNGALKGFSFSDHPRDQQNSKSPVNAKNPWGDESDASYVQAWDCSKPPTTGTGLGHPTLLGQGYVNVSSPKVPPGPPSTSGSLAGTMNATGSGFDQCSRNTYNNGNGPQGLIYQKDGSHFHEGGALADAPYYMEYDVAATPTKVQADDNFAPSADSQRPATTTSGLLGSGQPPLPADELADADGVWSGDHAWTNPFFLQKYTLQTGPVPHTYYGYVSAAAISKYGLSVPKDPTVGTYGQEACGGSPGYNPATNWQCARATWYLDSQGKDIDSRDTRLGKDPNAPAGADCKLGGDTLGCLRYGARVGDPYNLRDIDCYDQSIQAARAAGVGYGVATGQKCAANNAG